MIKNFLYLDIEKLNSLSSQVFEGVTEYILDEKISEKQNNESQKGPLGSGRILGDILKLGEKISERKFLHDYSYTLFEDKLIKEKKVSIYSDLESISDLNKRSFVKIKAKLVFNDVNQINYTLENFNDIGKALAHVTKYNDIQEKKEQLKILKSKERDRNKKAKLDHQYKNITNLSKLAKDEGLYHDQDFLENLAFILKYGFQDQLEVQMKREELLFSANLKRECLRENESLLIRKYGRHTETEIVLFGVVTQHGNVKPIDINGYDQEDGNLKEAIMNLIAHMTKMESTFTGKLQNEVVIDPIALYTEL